MKSTAHWAWQDIVKTETVHNSFSGFYDQTSKAEHGVKTLNFALNCPDCKIKQTCDETHNCHELCIAPTLLLQPLKR